MKQNVTQDMLSSLRDTLFNEIREDIESLSQTVTSAHREYHADGEAVIRDISVKVDNLLAKSLGDHTQGSGRDGQYGGHTPHQGEK
jgi:hypothetical protein